MNGLPYYKAYPRDFIDGTIGMDFEMKGAYRLVLDLIYMQGGNLPDDARYISGLLGCSVKKWNMLRAALINAGKIDVRGGFLGNYRADKELEILGSFQEKQRKNRANPNKNNDLKSPPSNHTEPDTDTDTEKKTPVPPSGETAPSKVEPRKSPSRGTRIPDDWHVGADETAAARAAGLPAARIAVEGEKFRDYWRGRAGQGATKADWPATWRNWCRRAAENTGGNSRPPPAPPRHRNGAAAAYEKYTSNIRDIVFEDENVRPSQPTFDLDDNREYDAHDSSRVEAEILAPDRRQSRGFDSRESPVFDYEIRTGQSSDLGDL